MSTPRQLARNLMEFCKESFAEERVRECKKLTPYFYYHRKPNECILPNRPSTRNQKPLRLRKSRCRELGGTFKKYKSELKEYEHVMRIGEKEIEPTCPICFEDYGKYRPAWACKECEHYLCAVCHDRMMREAIEDGETYFSCPMCRGECNNPQEVVEPGYKRPKKPSKKRRYDPGIE